MNMILRNHVHFHRLMPRLLSSISLSTPMKLHAEIKNLIASKKYQAVLDLFDRHHRISSNPTITLALKASAALRDYKSGLRIHEQLSEQSRGDPWIQSSLIHFYSTFTSMQNDPLNTSIVVQCNDVSSAEKVFSLIEKKTVFAYGAMFKGNSPRQSKRADSTRTDFHTKVTSATTDQTK